MPNPAVGIRLDEDIQNRLKALGELRNRSAHHLMKEAIEQYVSSEEELEAEKRLTQERYEAYELTGEYVGHQEMKNWASSLGAKSSKQ